MVAWHAYHLHRSQTRRGVVALLGLGALSLTYFLLVHRPLAAEVDNLQQQQQSLAARRLELRTEVSQLSHTHRLSELHRQLRVGLDTPEAFDAAAWIEALTAMASASGVAVEGLEAGEEVRWPILLERPYDVKVRGSYRKIAAFVEAIRRSSWPVDLTHLTVGAPTARQRGVEVLATIGVHVLTLIDPEAPNALTRMD